MEDTRLAARRIAFLDYLRVFAFMSVLVGHKFYGELSALAGDETVHVTTRYVITQLLVVCFAGGVGVVVFFLVSGYIIAHVIQSERAGEFAIKRFWRIYPLYAVAVLAEMGVDAYQTNTFKPTIKLLPQLLLLGDFFHLRNSLGGVEWTLRVEVMFYAFMGLLRMTRLTHEYRRLLPGVLVGVVFALRYAAPFPTDSFTRGYLTIYGQRIHVISLCNKRVQHEMQLW